MDRRDKKMGRLHREMEKAKREVKERESEREIEKENQTIGRYPCPYRTQYPHRRQCPYHENCPYQEQCPMHQIMMQEGSSIKRDHFKYYYCY